MQQQVEKKPEVHDPRRTVTQIDYRKHEKTVKELDRQEEEEDYQRKKQEAAQWCTLDHEHGPNCRRPVGGCSHDHQKEWQIYEKSTEEKVKAADRFRQEGNEAYKKQNFGLAAVHYRKALLQFDYTFANNEQEEKNIDDVKVPCLLNLAACKCQQEEWDEVLIHTRLALEINPRLVKAYYRQGLAYLARDQFEEAKDALVSAHEIEPHNKDVMGALQRLKGNMDNYKVRQKEVYKEMVSGVEFTDAATERTTIIDPNITVTDEQKLEVDHLKSTESQQSEPLPPVLVQSSGSASNNSESKRGVQFGSVQYTDVAVRNAFDDSGSDLTGHSTSLMHGSRSSASSAVENMDSTATILATATESIGSTSSMAYAMNNIAGNEVDGLRQRSCKETRREKLEAFLQEHREYPNPGCGALFEKMKQTASNDTDSGSDTGGEEANDGEEAKSHEKALTFLLYGAAGFGVLALSAFGAMYLTEFIPT